MDKKKEIEKLVDQYFLGKITDDQLFKLRDYFEEDSKDIESVFFENWENSPSRIDIKGLDQAFLSFKKQNFYKKVKFPSYSSLLKYAAVLLIGIFISSVLLVKTNFDFFRNNKTEYLDIEVPNGSKSKINLPDGSLVWLNSGSKLSYPGEFGSENRRVVLSGEAYFEVKRDEKVPFYVFLGDLRIKVLGTKFNVRSYSEEKEIQTTLISGKVVLEKNSDKSDELIYEMKPSEHLIYSKTEKNVKVMNLSRETGSTSKIVQENRNDKDQNMLPTEFYTAWKDNKLVFRDQRLSALKGRLEKWYDVEITLRDENVGSYSFTGSFEKETVEEALDAICAISDLEYTINHKQIEIYE